MKLPVSVATEITNVIVQPGSKDSRGNSDVTVLFTITDADSVETLISKQYQANTPMHVVRNDILGLIEEMTGLLVTDLPSNLITIDLAGIQVSSNSSGVDDDSALTSKSYVDTHDATTLASAKTYTDAETTRAEAAEATFALASDLTAEVSRAEAAEAALTTADQIQMVDVLVLSADIKTLKGTPVQLVAGQATKMIRPISASASLLAGTPYDVSSGGDLELLLGANQFGGSAPALSKNLLTQTADSIGFFDCAIYESLFDTHNHVEGLPLMLTQLGAGEYATGTGNLYIRVYYTVVSVH